MWRRTSRTCPSRLAAQARWRRRSAGSDSCTTTTSTSRRAQGFRGLEMGFAVALACFYGSRGLRKGLHRAGLGAKKEWQSSEYFDPSSSQASPNPKTNLPLQVVRGFQSGRREFRTLHAMYRSETGGTLPYHGMHQETVTWLSKSLRLYVSRGLLVCAVLRRSCRCDSMFS